MPVGVFAAARLVITALNRWAEDGFRTKTLVHVATTTPAVGGHEANVLALVIAAFALFVLVKAFWGPRQATEACRKGAEGEERLCRRLNKLERHGYTSFTTCEFLVHRPISITS